MPFPTFDSQNCQHRARQPLSETDATRVGAATKWRAMKATTTEAATRARGAALTTPPADPPA
eukprot:5038425-Pyramimonas_sp.AAC.1